MDVWKQTKADFLLELKQTEFFDFKITVKKSQRNEAINFFKGLGRFIDWIKHDALPIHSIDSTIGVKLIYA
jgi:hypothetical protein